MKLHQARGGLKAVLAHVHVELVVKIPLVGGANVPQAQICHQEVEFIIGEPFEPPVDFGCLVVFHLAVATKALEHERVKKMNLDWSRFHRHECNSWQEYKNKKS